MSLIWSMPRRQHNTSFGCSSVLETVAVQIKPASFSAIIRNTFLFYSGHTSASLLNKAVIEQFSLTVPVQYRRILNACLFINGGFSCGFHNILAIRIVKGRLRLGYEALVAFQHTAIDRRHVLHNHCTWHQFFPLTWSHFLSFVPYERDVYWRN